MEKALVVWVLLIVCEFMRNSWCNGKKPTVEPPLIVRVSSPKTISEAFKFRAVKNRKDSNFYEDYRRFDIIDGYMRKLAELNPSIVRVFTMGRSVEGRKLNVIRIGPGSKPAIWIDGGIHAREWISPATVVYIAEKLIEEYGEANKDKKSIARDFSWYVIPVLNPDGYEYSHVGDRMWRKNRSSNNTSCPGVDLNRNWSYHWNEGGASNDPCSEVYAGKVPFSEPESLAVSNFILKRIKKQKIVAYLTYHSYSQTWLHPWGWTKTPPDDQEELQRAAKKAVEAVFKVNGRNYKVSSSSKGLEVAAGGSDDWAKGAAGIKYSYTIELPDNGRFGFKMPKRYILPIAMENWEGVKAFARAISNQGKGDNSRRRNAKKDHHT